MKEEIMTKGLKKQKFILYGIVLIVFGLIIGAMFFKGYFSGKEKADQKVAELEAEIARLSEQAAVYENATKEISIGLIEAQIKDIGELATVEYMYTNAGKYSDIKQLFGIDIAFTEKSFIAKWDGVIKAGVKIEDVTVHIDDTNKQIIIHLPEAEILSHELDDTSFETFDEKDGVFNKIQVDDVREFDTKTKEAMEKRAIENGILEKAYKNAQDIIYRLVNTDAVEEQGYEVLFKTITE